MPKEISTTDEAEIIRKRLSSRRNFLNLTYQELAEKTGMNKATLQRYETGGIKNLPYEKILKLAEALEVEPNHFFDLSKDYTGADTNISSLISEQDRTATIREVREFESKAIAQITPKLISEGYTIEKRSSGSLGDLIATKGKKTWFIDFVYTKGIGIKKQQLLLRYGRLAIFNKPITKYSILMDSHAIPHDILNSKPIHLDIDITLLMLCDNGYDELKFR